MSTASTEPSSVARMATPVLTSYSEIVELCKSPSTPSSATLKKILDGLQHRNELASSRVNVHDKGMRESSKRKKEETERQRELTLQQMAEEEERERERERLRQVPLKKEQEDRPPAVGAHSVARQDGVSADGKLVSFSLKYCVLFSLVSAGVTCLSSPAVLSRSIGYWDSRDHAA